MLRFALLYAVLLVPQVALCQKFDFEDDDFLFTVDRAGDLLNGKILGVSVDSVLDAEVAKMLQKSGLTFGKNAVTFKVRVEDEPVAKRKCLYTSELRDASISGKIDVTEELQFRANTSFIVNAEGILPLDLQLNGTLHTDLKAPLGFTCPHLKDVETPISSDIMVEVKIKVVVFLNPTVEKRKGRTLLRLAPEIKVMEEITDIAADSDVEFKVFNSVRVKFVESLLEDIADEAIEKKGGKVLSRIVKRLKKSIQEWVDENLAGEEIDLGKTIDDAEASGALTELVSLAKLAFLAL